MPGCGARRLAWAVTGAMASPVSRSGISWSKLATFGPMVIGRPLGVWVGMKVWPARLIAADLSELPFVAEHAIAAGSLPLHHGNPFDRALIAQAMTEGLTLVTRDAAIHGYEGVSLLKA